MNSYHCNQVYGNVFKAVNMMYRENGIRTFYRGMYSLVEVCVLIIEHMSHTMPTQGLAQH